MKRAAVQDFRTGVSIIDVNSVRFRRPRSKYNYILAT